MGGLALSEAQVKKDLAEKEAEFLAQGGSFPHATTSSIFIALGLELEEAQMIDFKNKNIRGQRDGTQLTTIIDRVHVRARFAASKYRSARVAHLALAGEGDWENTYQVLEDKDVRGYQDPDQLRPHVGRRGIYEDGHKPSNIEVDEDDSIDLVNQQRNRRDGTGQTRRTLSWIWTVTVGVRTEEDHDNILRVEWAKSRARVMRAKEEVLLLKEEMRRMLMFLKHRSAWWVERQSALPGTRKDLAEGISAFAKSQAEIQTSLANHFQRLWAAPFSDKITENDDDDDNDDEGDEVDQVDQVPPDEDEEEEFENETEEPL
uniref:Uncharacterized protein n=1 Tax=Psilocybe cubensis TaxID=181762 RepID=A0A8H8CGI7_PSICU